MICILLCSLFQHTYSLQLKYLSIVFWYLLPFTSLPRERWKQFTRVAKKIIFAVHQVGILCYLCFSDPFLLFQQLSFTWVLVPLCLHCACACALAMDRQKEPFPDRSPNWKWISHCVTLWSILRNTMKPELSILILHVGMHNKYLILKL